MVQKIEGQTGSAADYFQEPAAKSLIEKYPTADSALGFDAFLPVLSVSSLLASIATLPLTNSNLLRLLSASNTQISGNEEPVASEKYLKRETADLIKLESALIEHRPDSAEGELQQLALLEQLAQQYLQKATQGDNEDDCLSLAEASYELLAKLASLSGSDVVHARARYYDSLLYLVGGDEETARSILADEVGDFPEAKSILETIGKVEMAEHDRQARDRHRMLALSVLDIWSIYADEGEAYEQDQAKGVLGVGMGTIRYYSESGHRTMSDHVAAKWNLDRDLIREIKHKIRTDQAETVHEALSQIAESGDAFAPRAKQLLEEETKKDNNGSYMLAHFIGYVSEDRADSSGLRRLMKDAEESSARMNAVQTPYAIASFLKATESDEQVREECAQQLAALEKGKNLPGIVWDMIRTTGTDDLAQLAIMAGASKVGSFARLAALGRLEKASITGYKALALAYGAEIVAEGTAMWAMNTVYESMLHDTEKVYEGKKLLKSWGANLVMIAGLKGAGGMASKYAPQVAKFAKFVENEKLTQTGMATVWGLNHLAGLGGMIGTTQLNQTLGLSETPKGGFKESLAHDLFSYVKYGAAQKGVDHVLGPDFVQAREERHNKIRLTEEKLLTAATHSQGESSILENPLLAPLWMMMGVDGIGGSGGNKSETMDKSVPLAADVQLKKLSDSLFDLRVKNPQDPEIQEHWSVIADYLQQKGDLRGKWIALELERQKLISQQNRGEQYHQIDTEMRRIEEEINEDIAKRFTANDQHVIAYKFDVTHGFTLKLRRLKGDAFVPRYQGSSAIDVLRPFTSSEYATLLGGLDLSYTRFGSKEMREILQFDALPPLSSLNLSRTGMELNELIDLHASIAKSKPLQKLGALNLAGNNIKVKGLRLLVQSEHLRDLWSLDLTYNLIGEVGARVLAQAETLSNLISLNLSDNKIGERGVRALAQSEHWRKLRSLELYQSDWGAKRAHRERVWGIIDESPNFPNLVEYNGSSVFRTKAKAEDPNPSNLDSGKTPPTGAQMALAGPALFGWDAAANTSLDQVLHMGVGFAAAMGLYFGIRWLWGKFAEAKMVEVGLKARPDPTVKIKEEGILAETTDQELAAEKPQPLEEPKEVERPDGDEIKLVSPLTDPTLGQLDESLLARQVENLHDPEIFVEWAVIADRLQEQGDPRGAMIVLGLERQQLLNQGDPQNRLPSLESEINRTTKKISADIFKRFGVIASLSFAPAVGFILDVSNQGTQQSSAVRKNFLRQFMESEYAFLLRGLSLKAGEFDVKHFEFEDNLIPWLANKDMFRNLFYLNLDGNYMSRQAVQSIARSSILTNLAYLSLNDCGILDDGVDAIANSTALSKLLTLNLSYSPPVNLDALFHLPVHQLDNNHISDRAVKALIESPHLKNLVSFNRQEMTRLRARPSSPKQTDSSD